jgi:hypothetical protein
VRNKAALIHDLIDYRKFDQQNALTGIWYFKNFPGRTPGPPLKRERRKRRHWGRSRRREEGWHMTGSKEGKA